MIRKKAQFVDRFKDSHGFEDPDTTKAIEFMNSFYDYDESHRTGALKGAGGRPNMKLAGMEKDAFLLGRYRMNKSLNKSNPGATHGALRKGFGKAKEKLGKGIGSAGEAASRIGGAVTNTIKARASSIKPMSNAVAADAAKPIKHMRMKDNKAFDGEGLNKKTRALGILDKAQEMHAEKKKTNAQNRRLGGGIGGMSRKKKGLIGAGILATGAAAGMAYKKNKERQNEFE